MSQLLVILFRILATLAAVLLTLSATSCDWTEVYSVETRVTADGKLVQQPRVTTVSSLRQQVETGGPCATVHHTTHDFGEMDPLTIGKHTFLIKNTGDSRLLLEQGATTCKCTLSKLAKNGLEPGEQTLILLTWNSGRDPVYHHHATILTNDPRHPAIRLSVKGRVRTLFRCSPEQIVFSEVQPGETNSASAIVYSQAWDDMEVQPVASLPQGIQCHIEPATGEAQRALQAKSAYRVTVTLPADLDAGPFMLPVRLEGKPIKCAEAIEPATCDLIVSGNVLRPIGVYGPAIDGAGTIRFDRLPAGQGGKVRLLVKVRDDERQLAVQDIQVQPEFLRVRFEPYKQTDAKPGLYYLYVEVPADAPTFRLPPDQFGLVRVNFDHPRIKDLELKVDLVILPRPSATLLNSPDK